MDFPPLVFQIFRHSCSSEKKWRENGGRGRGIYPLLSLLNHSCVANTKYVAANTGEMICVATLNIRYVVTRIFLFKRNRLLNGKQISSLKFGHFPFYFSNQMFAFSTPFYSNAAKSLKTSLTKLVLHNNVFSLLSTMCACFFARNCWNVANIWSTKIERKWWNFAYFSFSYLFYVYNP